MSRACLSEATFISNALHVGPATSLAGLKRASVCMVLLLKSQIISNKLLHVKAVPGVFQELLSFFIELLQLQELLHSLGVH